MKRSNKRPPLLVICAVLTYLVILTSSLSSGLYARYTSSDFDMDSARVARFEFCAESTSAVELIDLSDISTPGDSVTYQFKVANNNGASVCEVVQRYTVTVKVDGNMPLVCTLTQNGSAADSLETFSGSKRTLNVEGDLLAGEADEDTFSLTVEWPKDMNSADFANGMALGKITLTVVSQQTD